MITITDLSYRYPLGTQKVLNQVNLEIHPGSLTLVTGASGSGKSTLLRCINGLVPHFTGGQISGEINVFGANPITAGVEVMANIVGFVFQEPESQFVFDTVEDEIAFSLENIGASRETMEYHIQEALQVMNMSHLRHKKITEISGGEQQKVAIASALVTRPVVLVLDEPTSQLDPISADEVLRFILKLKTQLNLTVLISEHRLERLLPYTDLILNMQADQTVIFGKPLDILPKMDQVPTIIEIAQRLSISPLPLTTAAFPKMKLGTNSPSLKEKLIKSSHEPEIALSIKNLSTHLGDQLIVNDINFEVQQGEILVLMGPNGAGKTTLLRSILKMIPSSGKVTLNNVAVENLDFSEIIQQIAYLPQNPNDLLFAESVIDEMKITLKNHNLDENKVDLHEFLSSFGLGDKTEQYPRDLSVGERQRTALAAITVHDPMIIFLDEPTRGLDYQAKKRLSALFHSWRQQRKAILLITHDVEFAAHLADRVIILEEGQVIFIGSPRAAFTQYPTYQTQTARIFPGTGWISPEDVTNIVDFQ